MSASAISFQAGETSGATSGGFDLKGILLKG